MSSSVRSNGANFTSVNEYHLLGIQRQQELVMIVAGKPGSGKTTLIKNFLWPTTAETTAKINQPISSKRLISEHVNEVDGTQVQMFDISTYETHAMAELSSAVNGKEIILVYCLSMNYGSKVDDFDVAIIKKLSSVLTPQIWKSTILALTFANKVSSCDDDDEFDQKTVVESYAKQFEMALKSAQITDVCVQSISSVGDDLSCGVVAVPVGKASSSVPECDDWRKKLLFAGNRMYKLLHPLKQPDGRSWLTGLKVGVGSGVGAIVGGISGSAAGVTVLPGIVVGGLVGGVVGYAVHYFTKNRAIFS